MMDLCLHAIGPAIACALDDVSCRSSLGRQERSQQRASRVAEQPLNDCRRVFG
jgi:hypothetical protein